MLDTTLDLRSRSCDRKESRLVKSQIGEERMRKFGFALPLLVVGILYAAPLRAQVRNLDPVDNPLGDCSTASTPDECMATTISVCTKDYGCPQCGLSNDLNSSVCSTLAGQTGWCTCTPQNKVNYDKWGQKYGSCNSS